MWKLISHLEGRFRVFSKAMLRRTFDPRRPELKEA
jgi:hypothetical protein